MSIIKSILLVLVICYAAEAFNLGQIPDVIVGQLRKMAHLQQHQQPQQREHQLQDQENQQQQPNHHQNAHENHENNKAAEGKPRHQTEIVDEKERIYLVPKKGDHGNKIEDQIVVLEKEVIRRVLDDNEEPGEGNLFFDEGEFDEHDAHVGKSVFSDAGDGHFGADDNAEFCGGKPDEEPEEPEHLQKLNNFDAIAEAILERRLGNLRRDDDEDDDDEDEEERDERHHDDRADEKRREDRRHREKNVEQLSKPSGLTADEAKLWNQKLSEAIKNRRANPSAQKKAVHEVNV